MAGGLGPEVRRVLARADKRWRTAHLDVPADEEYLGVLADAVIMGVVARLVERVGVLEGWCSCVKPPNPLAQPNGVL